MPQTSDLLEKSALIFLYNFHREHSLLKLVIKKLSPKINVKNIKKSFFFIFFLRIMFKILFSYKSTILIYIHVSDIDIVLLFCCDHFYDFVIKFTYTSILTVNCYIHVCLTKKLYSLRQ